MHFVVLLSFLIGLEDVSLLSFFYYQKDYLKLTPEFIQSMAALISIPWTLKPIFGFIFDQIMKKLKKGKYMVFLCAILKILCYLSLGYFKTNTAVFFILYFLITMGNLFISIICEYLLVLSSK